MASVIRRRGVVGWLALALVSGAFGPMGCGGDGAGSGPRVQEANRPIVPPGLSGPAAKRAAEPDGRPRGRPGT
jgi:hypothetical protein